LRMGRRPSGGGQPWVERGMSGEERERRKPQYIG
jgi:hypothetical protein